MVKTLAKWKNCEACGLCEYRRQVVFGRGKMPATILMVGAAPGKTENLMGEAFKGPSGRVLNSAIRDAAKLMVTELPSIYMTTVIACRPTNSKTGETREPTEDEAWACWSRLQETAHLVRPKAIILLGDFAKNFCLPAWPDAKSVQHPGYILSVGGIGSPQYRTLYITLAEIFKGALNDG